MPSARDVLRVLFRHKVLIVLVFGAVTAAGATFVMLMPPQYESEARLLLRPERGDISIDPTSPGLVNSLQGQSSNSTENEISILSSRLLHERVARELGPDRILGLRDGQTIEEAFRDDPNPQEAAVKTAARILGLVAVFEPLGDIVVVKYQNSDPQVAHDVVAKLVECYLERHVEVHRSSFNPEIFKRESEEIMARIRAKELEQKQYTEGRNGMSVQERRSQLLSEKARYWEQIAQNRVDQEASLARMNSLDQSLVSRDGDSKIPPSQMENPELLIYKEQLTQLQIEKTKLESVFTGGSQLEAVNYQIEEIKNKIKTLPATVPRSSVLSRDGVGVDPYMLLSNERTNYEALKATGIALQAEYDKTMTQLEHIGDDTKQLELDQELVKLRADWQRANDAYNDVALNARLDEEKVSNVSVLNPPSLPDLPVGPKRMRDLALVLFVAIAASVGMAALREFMDDTLKTRDEVEKKLGIPVLAVVPAEEFRKCI